jgi:polyisoprenoid-binding protein YceI
MIRATVVAVVALLALGSSSFAQEAAQIPGRADPARIAAGTYKVDPTHTQIAFTINHFGFNNYHGLFGGSTGKLTFDPAHPEASTLAIETPIDQLETTSDKLNEHLKTADFFDLANYPAARFRSTKVTVTGQRAKITGDFTLHGVSRPVVLDARFTGAGTNPITKGQTIGFQARTSIKRSDYGMNFIVPLVSDEVALDITAAFELAGDH